MERSSTTMIIVMLIVGLGIGGGIGYYMAPTKEVAGEVRTITVEVAPLDGKTIRLGHVTSSTTNLEQWTPLDEEIIIPDINDFAKKLGYDVSFEVLIDTADSQAAIHLEKVQSFKAMDINLIIGGQWSSQAQAALSYVNENDILLFSPSSTSPLLAIADDNLYRMCPDDTVQAPAIAEMLWSWGIKAIIVIQRGDSWADGIYNILEIEYPNRGGVILERIRFAAEATEFSSYLASAEDIAADAVAQYGAEHVAIETISFGTETTTMLTQAEDYPTLWSLLWFGSDGTAMVAQFIDDAPEQADHLKVFSTLAAPGISPKFSSLYDRYYAIMSLPFGYYSATNYDTFWTIAMGVLDSQSTDANDVIPTIFPITYNQWGASGWTLLNEAGDRKASNYDIWGYGYDSAGNAVNVRYGLFDGTSGKVTWYPVGMTPAGEEVPGVTPPGQ